MLKIALAVAATVSATTSAPTPNACCIVTGESSPDQIFATFSRAYDLRDVDLVANLYAEDAYILANNPSEGIRLGKAAIREGFAGQFRRNVEAKEKVQIKFRIVDRRLTGSQAVDIGFFRLLVRDEATNAVRREVTGKFLMVSQMEANGRWHLRYDADSRAPAEAYDRAVPAGFHFSP